MVALKYVWHYLNHDLKNPFRSLAYPLCGEETQVLKVEWEVLRGCRENTRWWCPEVCGGCQEREQEERTASSCFCWGGLHLPPARSCAFFPLQCLETVSHFWCLKSISCQLMALVLAWASLRRNSSYHKTSQGKKDMRQSGQRNGQNKPFPSLWVWKPV